MNRIVILIVAMVIATAGTWRAVRAQEAVALDGVDAIVDDVVANFSDQVAAIGGRDVFEADVAACSKEFGSAETAAVFETIGPSAETVLTHVPASLKSEAFQFMAEDGAKSLYVLESSSRLALFDADGLPAAQAMAKYPGIAQDAIARDGLPAARAINALDSTDATRLDAMIDDGSLAKEGDAPALLDRIANGGKKSFAAIWKNRMGLLAAGGTLAVVSAGAAVVGVAGRSVASGIDGVHAALHAATTAPISLAALLASMLVMVVLAWLLWRAVRAGAGSLTRRIAIALGLRRPDPPADHPFPAATRAAPGGGPDTGAHNPAPTADS